MTTNTPLFGINVDPSTADLQETYRRAQIADENGLDMLMIQDHPYNRRFLDTWTLLTAIAMRTEQIRIGTNVANLPLRPPVMLAKAAATLDVLSGGRVELGLGAGAFWQGVNAFGGPTRTPGEAYAAFDDALHIMYGLWNSAGRSFTYTGKVYEVRGASFGPNPAHPINIWVGASGPKMLNLTGRMADGVLVSSTYESPERLLEINRQIDEGAAEAGRPVNAIRRGYNLMGIIDMGQLAGKPTDLQPGILYGSTDEWVEMLTRYYIDYGMDTFIFWPIGGQPLTQIETFANTIAPAVHKAVVQAHRAAKPTSGTSEN